MTRLINLLFHDIYRQVPAESGFSGSAADRYKLSLTNVVCHFEAMAKVRKDPPELVSLLPEKRTKKAIPYTISVDDGGVSYYTLLADMLEKRGWRGHCLITTSKIGQRGFLSREQIRELHDRGHVIGTHTHTHPQWFNVCPRAIQVQEWQYSKSLLEDITGEEVDIGSVPGGYFSPGVAEASCEAGLNTLFTSEPHLSVRSVNGCRILGRYALRHNSRLTHTAALVRGDKSVLLREWALWNGKKVLKKSLGPQYEFLSSLLHRETL